MRALKIFDKEGSKIRTWMFVVATENGISYTIARCQMIKKLFSTIKGKIAGHIESVTSEDHTSSTMESAASSSSTALTLSRSIIIETPESDEFSSFSSADSDNLHVGSNTSNTSTSSVISIEDESMDSVLTNPPQHEARPDNKKKEHGRSNTQRIFLSPRLTLPRRQRGLTERNLRDSLGTYYDESVDQSRIDENTANEVHKKFCESLEKINLLLRVKQTRQTFFDSFECDEPPVDQTKARNANSLLIDVNLFSQIEHVVANIKSKNEAEIAELIVLLNKKMQFDEYQLESLEQQERLAESFFKIIEVLNNKHLIKKLGKPEKKQLYQLTLKVIYTYIRCKKFDLLRRIFSFSWFVVDQIHKTLEHDDIGRYYRLKCDYLANANLYDDSICEFIKALQYYQTHFELNKDVVSEEFILLLLWFQEFFLKFDLHEDHIINFYNICQNLIITFVDQKFRDHEHPLNSLAALALGNLYYHIGRYSNAMQEYKKALNYMESGGEKLSGRYNFQSTGSEVGEYDDSSDEEEFEEDLSDTRKIRFNLSAEIHCKIAQCYFELGETDKAKRNLKKSLKYDEHSNSPRLIDGSKDLLLAKIDYVEGRVKRAYKIFYRLSNLEGSESLADRLDIQEEAKLYLANIAGMQGSYDRADELFQEALKIQSRIDQKKRNTRSKLRFLITEKLVERLIRVNESNFEKIVSLLREFTSQAQKFNAARENSGRSPIRTSPNSKVNFPRRTVTESVNAYYFSINSAVALYRAGYNAVRRSKYVEGKNHLRNALYIFMCCYDLRLISTCGLNDIESHCIKNLGSISDPRIALCLLEIANAEFRLGCYTEAKKLAQYALVILQIAYPRFERKEISYIQHDVAYAHYFIACVLIEVGAYEEANLHLDELENTFIQSPLVRVRSKYCGALIHYHELEYDKAKELLYEGVNILMESEYQLHPYVVRILAILGRIEYRLGNYFDEDCFNSLTYSDLAIKIFKNYYCYDDEENAHINLGIFYRFRGDVFFKIGNFSKAHQHHSNALKIFSSLQLYNGNDSIDNMHPEVIRIQNTMSAYNYRRGEYQDALNRLEANQIRQKALYDSNDAHPALIDTQCYIANIYFKLGQLKKAHQLFGEIHAKKTGHLDSRLRALFFQIHAENALGNRSLLAELFKEINELEINGNFSRTMLYRLELSHAECLFRERNFQKSVQKCNKAIDMLPKIQAQGDDVGLIYPRHLYVARALRLRAVSKFSMGLVPNGDEQHTVEAKDDYTQACRLLREIYFGSESEIDFINDELALEMLEQFKEKEVIGAHVDIAEILYSYGYFLIEEGKNYELAERVLRNALVIRQCCRTPLLNTEHDIGDKKVILFHPDTCALLRNFIILEVQKNHDQAVEKIDDALSALKNIEIVLSFYYDDSLHYRRRRLQTDLLELQARLASPPPIPQNNNNEITSVISANAKLQELFTKYNLPIFQKTTSISPKTKAESLSTTAGIAGGTQTFNGPVFFDITGGKFEMPTPSAARETAAQQTNVKTQKGQKLSTTQPNQGENVMPKINEDNRPSDRDYAVLSNHVYGGNKLKEGDAPKDPADWKVVETQSAGQFFGAIYQHKKTNHVIVAYRGTQGIGDLIEDLRGIFNNNELSPYKEAAFDLTQRAIKLAEKAESGLSFTGHSLGAYLAELSVYYCYAYYPQKKAQAGAASGVHSTSAADDDDDVDDKVESVVSAVSEFDIRDSVHAVTFESPGTRDVMEKLQSQLDAGKVKLKRLDITTYLSYPNLVNTCNQHVGTAYSLDPEISSWSNVPGWHLKQVHSMTHIVALFNNAKTQNYCPERHFMLDWPQGSQRDYYFQNVRLEGKKYTWTKPVDELAVDFKLLVGGRFRIDKRLSDWKMIPLRHFNRPMQDWLENFYPIMIKCSQSDVFLVQAKAEWEKSSIPSHIIGYLLSCVLVKEKEKGTAYLSIESENVEQTGFFIRRELSRWLSENSGKAVKLLETIQTLQARPDIEVALAGPGGRITRGTITNPKLRGVFVDISPDTDPQMLEYFNQVSKFFLQTLKDSGVTIGTYLAAGGGVLEDVNITGVELTGVKIQVNDPQRVLEKDLSVPAKKKQQTSSLAKPTADQFAQLNRSAPSSTSSTSATSSSTATTNKTAEKEDDSSEEDNSPAPSFP